MQHVLYLFNVFLPEMQENVSYISEIFSLTLWKKNFSARIMKMCYIKSSFMWTTPDLNDIGKNVVLLVAASSSFM